jgi:hypothetical protein
VIVTLKSADGDQVWPFKPDRLLTTEAEAIEKVTGLTFGEWGAELMKGGAAARRSLVWVLRKRQDPPLRYRDVDFPVGDLLVEYDPEEKAQIRQAIAADPSLTDEQREQAAAELGPEEPEPDPTPATAG